MKKGHSQKKEGVRRSLFSEILHFMTIHVDGGQKTISWPVSRVCYNVLKGLLQVLCQKIQLEIMRNI